MCTTESAGLPGEKTAIRVLFEGIEGETLLQHIMAIEKEAGNADGALRKLSW